MSIRTIMIVVGALMCAGASVLGVNQLISKGGGVPPTSAVMVVIGEVRRGEAITAKAVEPRKFPKGLSPEGAITRAEDCVGRVALHPFVKGEPLIEAKLAPKGAKGGIASLIPKGMRAIAIQTPNIATGVAGFILPGNRVDVLVTLNEPMLADRLGVSTMTLLENLEILAVDQQVDAPANNKVDAAQMRSVTLLVTPEQAGRLNLAMNKGTLHLSLRNPTDDKAAVPKPATLQDIRPELAAAPPKPKPIEEPPPPAPKAPEPPPKPATMTIRTIRSTRESVVFVNPRR